MKKPHNFILILILGALTALGPFSIDMYLPGFPAIAKSFKIDTGQVSLSLSSFFLGMAAGQILYGPLLDRFGRKKPLYGGLILYIVASAGCYSASSIETLIIFRFLQAIGSCPAGIVAIAMVRDLFPVKDNAKIFSLLMIVLGSSPMIAPTVGGFISDAFGWRTIFIMLSVLASILLCVVYLILPETGTDLKKNRLNLKNILAGYGTVIQTPKFIVYALGGGIAVSGLFAYLSASPGIFMEGYGLSRRAYGGIFAAITIGFIGFSQFNTILSKFFAAREIVFGAVICMVMISSAFVIGLNQGWLGLAGTAFMLFLVLCCIGIINPNIIALSMAPFENDAGSAASLFGLIQWGIAGTVAVLVGSLKSTSGIPLACIMAASALISLIIFFFGGRSRDNKIQNIL